MVFTHVKAKVEIHDTSTNQNYTALPLVAQTKVVYWTYIGVLINEHFTCTVFTQAWTKVETHDTSTNKIYIALTLVAQTVKVVDCKL